MENSITITIKLFAGIDKDLDIDDYNRQEGITLKVPKGTRLKKAVKLIGLSDRYAVVYFIHGERIGFRRKLEDGDEIVCLKPAAGG